MSLVTAVPFHDEDNVKTYSQVDSPVTLQTSYSRSNKAILYLGFVTGLLLETCDLGVVVLTVGTNVEVMWQQVLFSLAWSCMVALIACLVMMCIRCLSNNANAHFSSTFLFGTVCGLASAIAANQVMKGSWQFVVIVPVSIMAIVTFQIEGMCTETCENEKRREEKLMIV